MFTSSRILLLCISRSQKQCQRFHTGPPRNNFDTGIEGFEQNKKAHRNPNQKRLPSFLDTVTYLSEDEVKKMYQELQGVVDEMVNLSYTKGATLGNRRTREMMEYTLPWSPPCATQTLMANKFYVEIRRATGKMLPDEEGHEQLSYKLAWALEMLARPALLLDDIIDGSDHRQGLPCWHTVLGVGLHAVNDLVLLTHGGNYLLNKYFGQTCYFSNLMEHVSKTFMKTGVGENGLHLMAMEIKSNPNVMFTEEDLSIVKILLNAQVFPNLPVVAAMWFNGITDPELIRTAYEIGELIATYNIVIDDWSDLYGEFAVNERKSCDIEMGRMTWLLFTACRLANKEQRMRLTSIYGEKDGASVEEVKSIYSDLNIREIVKEMGEGRGYALEQRISQLPPNKYPTIVWLHMLDHYRETALGKAARP